MRNEIEKLKEKFRHAESDEELANIDEEIGILANQAPDKFSRSMIEAAQNTAEEVNELLLRERLKDILPVISVSYLAKTYFSKTPQWFYQRLNGNKVNGKVSSFSRSELTILARALTEISDKLRNSAALVL